MRNLPGLVSRLSPEETDAPEERHEGRSKVGTLRRVEERRAVPTLRVTALLDDHRASLQR